MTRVAVLTSGGVDSSVALARLATEGGHDLTAFYLKIWLEDELAFLGSCPWEEDLAFVREICERFGVPLEEVPLQREYYDRVVAAAVTELFPDAKYGFGPPIDGGFFYDFVVDEPFTPEDLQKIEDKMKELAAEKIPFVREDIPKEEAIEAFKRLNQPFKEELVDEKGDSMVSCYRVGPFYDFCEGPHIPDTSVIKAIKVKLEFRA